MILEPQADRRSSQPRWLVYPLLGIATWDTVMLILMAGDLRRAPVWFAAEALVTAVAWTCLWAWRRHPGPAGAGILLSLVVPSLFNVLFPAVVLATAITLIRLRRPGVATDSVPTPTPSGP